MYPSPREKPPKRSAEFATIRGAHFDEISQNIVRRTTHRTIIELSNYHRTVLRDHRTTRSGGAAGAPRLRYCARINILYVSFTEIKTIEAAGGISYNRRWSFWRNKRKCSPTDYPSNYSTYPVKWYIILLVWIIFRRKSIILLGYHFTRTTCCDFIYRFIILLGYNFSPSLGLSFYRFIILLWIWVYHFTGSFLLF